MSNMRPLSGVCVLAAFFALTGCEVAPRTSFWHAPQRYSRDAVVRAAVQAGAQEAMQLAFVDRKSGTMSFETRSGNGQMVLSVNVAGTNGHVTVQATAALGGDIGIAGLDKEFIDNFYVLLFRDLDITSPNERRVGIGEVS